MTTSMALSRYRRCNQRMRLLNRSIGWLGAHFDQKRSCSWRGILPILGVTYNLIEMTLEIKESRKKDLLEEMDSILESKLMLDPGTAGKLKGKLMFGASQLWGKVGRAFLRSISERQYARFALQDGFKT